MLVVVLDMWTCPLVVLDKCLKGKAVSTETEKAYWGRWVHHVQVRGKVHQV